MTEEKWYKLIQEWKRWYHYTNTKRIIKEHYKNSVCVTLTLYVKPTNTDVNITKPQIMKTQDKTENLNFSITIKYIEFIAKSIPEKKCSGSVDCNEEFFYI